jgi:hypothetical protein
MQNKEASKVHQRSKQGRKIYIRQSNYSKASPKKEIPIRGLPQKDWPQTQTEKENRFSKNGAVQEQGGQEER